MMAIAIDASSAVIGTMNEHIHLFDVTILRLSVAFGL